jgi:hypothetical protein
VDVKRSRNAYVAPVLLLLVFQVSFVTSVAAQEAVDSTALALRLEALILEQQQVMKRQQQQLEEQQQQLNSLRQEVGELRTATTETLNEAKDAKRVAVAAQESVRAPSASANDNIGQIDDNVVQSAEDSPVKLVVKGFINRMVNVVGDGKNTEAYFVDNDNAESRVSFVGTLDATKDLTIGTNIELTIAPSKSGNINQNNKDQDNIFDQRKVEVSFDSKRYGKLTFGKGNTASFNSGASDLSGTAVIAYATISDTAGGMLFREKNGGDLTDIRIVDAFNNWDGLNRLSRLRYDSPNISGFTFATSAISDNRYDAALRWGGQGYGFKTAGAAAIADPNEDDQGFNFTGSFSALHEETGLNFTVSAGSREFDGRSDPYNLYGKLGWRTNFFSVGETAFGVDYTLSKRIPDAGDEGYSVGLAAVQQFDDYGFELYAQYRLHSLDRDAGSVDDINVFSVGTRVRF